MAARFAYSTGDHFSEALKCYTGIVKIMFPGPEARKEVSYLTQITRLTLTRSCKDFLATVLAQKFRSWEDGTADLSNLLYAIKY